LGKTKPFSVVNSEHLSKRNVLEGPDVVFYAGVKDICAKSYSVP